MLGLNNYDHIDRAALLSNVFQCGWVWAESCGILNETHECLAVLASLISKNVLSELRDEFL